MMGHPATDPQTPKNAAATLGMPKLPFARLYPAAKQAVKLWHWSNSGIHRAMKSCGT